LPPSFTGGIYINLEVLLLYRKDIPEPYQNLHLSKDHVEVVAHKIDINFIRTNVLDKMKKRKKEKMRK